MSWDSAPGSMSFRSLGAVAAEAIAVAARRTTVTSVARPATFHRIAWVPFPVGFTSDPTLPTATRQPNPKVSSAHAFRRDGVGRIGAGHGRDRSERRCGEDVDTGPDLREQLIHPLDRQRGR